MFDLCAQMFYLRVQLMAVFYAHRLDWLKRQLS